MSKLVTILCDQCRTRGRCDEEPSAARVRAHLRRWGWRYTNGRDLCAECRVTHVVTWEGVVRERRGRSIDPASSPPQSPRRAAP